jgi:hypothetical protein
MKSFGSLLFLLFLSLIQSSTQQVPNRIKLESQLTKVSTALVQSEQRFNKSLENYRIQANYIAKPLSKSALPQTHKDLVNKIALGFDQIRTLKNFQVDDLTLDIFDSYNYAQFRILTTSSDAKNLRMIIEQAKDNATLLYKLKVSF